jgi:hypothetical protein
MDTSARKKCNLSVALAEYCFNDHDHCTRNEREVYPKAACRTLTHLFTLAVTVASLVLLYIQCLLPNQCSTRRNPASGNSRSVLRRAIFPSSIHFPFATGLGRHGLLLKMLPPIHYSWLKFTGSHPGGLSSVCSTPVSRAFLLLLCASRPNE